MMCAFKYFMVASRLLWSCLSGTTFFYRMRNYGRDLLVGSSIRLLVVVLREIYDILFLVFWLKRGLLLVESGNVEFFSLFASNNSFFQAANQPLVSRKKQNHHSLLVVEEVVVVTMTLHSTPVWRCWGFRPSRRKKSRTEWWPKTLARRFAMIHCSCFAIRAVHLLFWEAFQQIECHWLA